MNNKELAYTILQKMEDNHINLYHSVSKRHVQKYISLVDWNNLDDIKFTYHMLKLFAMFKESHLQYFSVPWEMFDKDLQYINKTLYLKIDNEYFKIVKINNIPTKKVIKQIASLVPTETKPWLENCLTTYLINAYYYKMIGIVTDSKIVVLVDHNGRFKEHIVNIISAEEYISLFGNPNREPNYKYKLLNKDILYLKYLRCLNDNPNFADFCKELEEIIVNKKLTKYILDIRDNIGGDSLIIKPFVDIVKKHNLKGVLLVNKGTYSSGKLAIVTFKKNFNSLTIGEPIGGKGIDYGDTKHLKVEKKGFSVSTQYFDYSKQLKTKGTVKPDIKVKTTLEDIKNNYDRCLDVAIKYLNDNKNKSITMK